MEQQEINLVRDFLSDIGFCNTAFKNGVFTGFHLSGYETKLIIQSSTNPKIKYSLQDIDTGLIIIISK